MKGLEKVSFLVQGSYAFADGGKILKKEAFTDIEMPYPTAEIVEAIAAKVSTKARARRTRARATRRTARSSREANAREPAVPNQARARVGEVEPCEFSSL